MQQTNLEAGTQPSIQTPKQMQGAQVALLILVFAAVFFAYFIQPTEGQGTSKNPKSAMRWLMGHWEELSNYSHGPLIPLISAGLILRRSKRFLPLWDKNQPFRILCIAVCALVAIGVGWDQMPKDLTKWLGGWLDKVGWGKYNFESITLFLPLWGALGFYLTEQTPAPTKWGLWVTIFGVLLYFIGVKSAQPHTVVGSFIVLLYGLCVYLWGREASRALVFPISFLVLMVPLNFLDQVTVPLARLVTIIAANICNFIGVEVVSRGTEIQSAKGAFQFKIAEACSGIRSLVALGMVTGVYAYLTETTQWKRWAIFMASLPLAVLGNIGRVVTIMLVAQAWGQELAGGLYHEYSAFIFFPVALLGMLVFAALLNLNYRQLWARMMTPAPARPTESRPAPRPETPI